MKITSKLTLCNEPSEGELERVIQETLSAGAKSLFILACEADKWHSKAVGPLLIGLNVPVFGGVFPRIIFEGRLLDHGTLVVGLNDAVELFLVESLDSSRHDINEEIQIASQGICKAKHLITIVDGLAENIESLIEALYGITGQNTITIGCGSGSLDFVKRPSLFSNKGMIQNAALIAAIPTPFNLGVSHGWEVLKGPYLVTKSNGNILEELNYSPAFNVYREHVEENSGLRFSDFEFFDIAKTYPLGIENHEGDILVRDPIVLKGQSLVCVGEIAENSVVYLLKGKPENLIMAAGSAAKKAYQRECSINEDSSVIVFDCISRALFLNNEFEKELESIKANIDEHEDFFGALTLGEISSTKNGPIEWLNKSTVISVF